MIKKGLHEAVDGGKQEKEQQNDKPSLACRAADVYAKVSVLVLVALLVYLVISS